MNDSLSSKHKLIAYLATVLILFAAYMITLASDGTNRVSAGWFRDGLIIDEKAGTWFEESVSAPKLCIGDFEMTTSEKRFIITNTTCPGKRWELDFK